MFDSRYIRRAILWAVLLGWCIYQQSLGNQPTWLLVYIPIILIINRDIGLGITEYFFGDEEAVKRTKEMLREFGIDIDLDDEDKEGE